MRGIVHALRDHARTNGKTPDQDAPAREHRCHAAGVPSDARPATHDEIVTFFEAQVRLLVRRG
jgi:hypothetical protein